MLYTIILLLSVIPHSAKEISDIRYEHVDVVEFNNYYTWKKESSKYEICFTQMIFKSWSRQLKCHYIIDWRLARHVRPQRIGNKYYFIWNDNGVLREITTNSFVETHTNFDPEREQLAKYPYLDRRDLK